MATAATVVNSKSVATTTTTTTTTTSTDRQTARARDSHHLTTFGTREREANY